MAANYALMKNRQDNLEILAKSNVQPSELGQKLAAKANFVQQNAS